MLPGLFGQALRLRGRFGRPRLLIFSYHRVLPRLDPLRNDVVDTASFKAQLDWLKRYLQPLALAEGVEALRAGSLTRDAFAITFDDGYADNLIHAAPLLKARQIPATYFITTGYLDGGIMWNDKLTELARQLPVGEVSMPGVTLPTLSIQADADRPLLRKQLITAVKHLPFEQREALVDRWVAEHNIDLPDGLMMRSGQVSELAGYGIEVGGHTIRHPILSRLDDNAAMEEIAAPMQPLRALTGRAPRLFAYPNGRRDDDFGGREARMVEEAGYVAAVTTEYAAATAASSRFELPRIVPWHTRLQGFAGQVAKVGAGARPTG